MKPGFVINLLEEDMKNTYEEFTKKNVGIKVETEYAFHYVADVSENLSGELMSVALMRTNDGFNKVEFSPIVKLTAKQYEAIVNGGEDEEDSLIHNIVKEEIQGDELYGLVGYITKGEFTTLDMYMQNLCDIVPIFKKMQKRRKEVVKYKRHRINNKIYMSSIGIDASQDNEDEEILPGENDMIV